MSARRVDKLMVIAVVCTVIGTGVAALSSVYASRQAGQYFEQVSSKALGQKPVPSSWSVLRYGSILGTYDSAKGNHVYVLTLRRPGGEYRALADVGKDGAILSVVTLGMSNGFIYSNRIEALLARIIGQRKDGDASPLDGMIKPLVIDVVETIANLEYVGSEMKHGK
jgi:hypothetical protein